MPGWTHWPGLLAAERAQALEEGKDPGEIARVLARFPEPRDAAAALEALQTLPESPDRASAEPNALEAIHSLRPPGPRKLDVAMDDATLFDRLYGAWLGRCCGCALGKPVEDFMDPKGELTSRGRQRAYLSAIAPEEYPIRDYIPEHSPAEASTGRVGSSASTREHIKYMESDDDIRYTLLNLELLERHGAEFATGHVAQQWLHRLPYAHVCTAETQAYRNLALHCETHERSTLLEEGAVNWEWVATHANPYREWIGAQIRADAFGYAVPGHCERAAALAWRDARLSHVKNGIYGEMFCAAMIAAAFALEDPLEVVQAGLAEIPADSRLATAVRETVALCGRTNQFEEVLDEIEGRLGHYAPVHTINNAAVVAAALLLGGHDFEKVITIAVMGGWDTDCNGATAGSIAGAMLGAERLPEKWTGRLNDTILAELPGFHPIAISECARRSLAVAVQFA